MDLTNNRYCKIGLNTETEEDENLYMVIQKTKDEYTHKVSKAGDYYYLKAKQLLTELGIDGLETNYSSYNSETTSNLSNIAKKFNLLESGGSDYHGENKPNINIGFGYENKPLKTPYEFLLKMKEKHAGI